MTSCAAPPRLRWHRASAVLFALCSLMAPGELLPAMRAHAEMANAAVGETADVMEAADTAGTTGTDGTTEPGNSSPASSTPASSTPAPVAIEDDGERLIAPIPQDWTLVARTNTGDLRTLEYAPLPAMPKTGDERIVIESSRTSPVTDPREFLRMLARDAHRHCEPLQARELSHRDENGYPTSVWLLDCPLGPGKGTPLQMLKAIRGDAWFYVISRTSTRADTRPENVANEHIRIGDWSQHMRRITACHLVRPDHPCPRAQSGTP